MLLSTYNAIFLHVEKSYELYNLLLIKLMIIIKTKLFDGLISEINKKGDVCFE